MTIKLTRCPTNFSLPLVSAIHTPRQTEVCRTLGRIAVVIVFLTICGTSASRAIGQQNSNPKPQPVRVIQFDGDMALLLATLADSFEATIGFKVGPKQQQPRVSLYVRDATLPDILNAIVKSAPGYQWREQNGCFEVLPMESTNPLLDTLINNFRVSEVHQVEAFNRLMSLPEVQASMRAMSLNRRDPNRFSTEKKTEKFSLNLENVTMRQAFSKIAQESGGGFWIFRNFGDGSFSISNSPL